MLTAQAPIANAPRPTFAALAAVHFRAVHGFAIISLKQPDRLARPCDWASPLTIGTVAFYVLRARVPHDVVMVCGDSPVSVESED